MLVTASSLGLRAEEELVQLEPIVVTATRYPTAKFNTNRTLIIIDQSQISSMPAESITGLLRHTAAVDVRRRGVEGSTADISIRGAGFEESLILLNGIPLNDPQTGHHNLDIPLTIADIERIEIMPGSSSSLYGSAASGGVINIITRVPEEEGGKINLAYGEHQYKRGAMMINFPFQDLANQISFEAVKSGGFRHNTELELRSFNFLSRLGETLDFYFGFQEKDFGANGFYSLSYPDQQEETQTILSAIQGKFEKFNHTFYPKLFYRRHQDHYVLDETRSAWYLNQHTSYSYGGEVSTVRKFANFDYLVGLSIAGDEVASTRLGNHDRGHYAVFIQGKAKILNDKVLLGLGIREDHYAGWGWEPSPSINAGWFLGNQLKLRASASRSFRVPSFTDLYYTSSTSVGNPDLTPEKAWTYEIGFDTIGKFQGLGVTVFRRKGRDIIDWARAQASDPWRAENIEDVDTNGVEFSWDAWPKFLKVSYTYLDSDRTKTTQSRYVLDYLKHKLAIRLDFAHPQRFKETINLSYQGRVEDKPFWVFDARISYQRRDKSKFFLEAANLFNKTYCEQGDLPMPGRWIKVGMEYEF